MVNPGGPEVVDPRRVPRVPVRLRVTIRHRSDAWAAETEDVGPRGCQVVSERALAPGSGLVLSVSGPGFSFTATGFVAWSRPAAPARMGISFAVPVAQRRWFDALLAADVDASRAAARVPLRLRRDAPLYLGEPPTTVVDFSEDERAVLEAIGPGASAGDVAESLARRFHRARGALFSLVARRIVLLRPGLPGAFSRWRAILAPSAPESPRRPAPRPATAQQLYDEGMSFLGAGRVELAVSRLRAALAEVPGDPGIAGTLARLERWW